MANSYSEKFKMELTSRELEVIEYALELYLDSGAEAPLMIERLIKKLYSEAYN